MSHLASAWNIRETLFTTNQTPSRQELHVIDATLVQLHANLNTYLSQNVPDARIADTAASILRLKSTLTPMRYIPDDILALIFEYATPWCLADGIAKHSFPPRLEGSLGVPWTLSHVCQNWRALSLSLPRLWSVFRTSFAELYDPQRAERTDALYQRSGPMTLRLYIETSYYLNNGPPVPLTFTPRWRCLKFTHRWRCLRIDAPVHRTDFHEDLLDHPFPSLTHLALDVPWEYTLTAVVSAPFLQNLEVQSALAGCSLELPWNQITRFKYVSSSCGFFDMMENLKEIVMVEVGRDYNYGVYDLDDEGSDCLQVRRLVHKNYSGDPGFEVYTQLFTQCKFASLHTLVIVESDCTYDKSKRPLFSFSLPSVVELSLCIGKADYMRNIFLATPNVQNLHLESKRNLGSVLCSPGCISAAMLCRLKHLSLTLRRTPGTALVGLDAVDAAFSSFKLKGVPLETVSFYSGIPRDEEGGEDEDEEKGNEDNEYLESTVYDGDWVTQIQTGLNDSMASWLEGGLQVLYHYNAEQRFSKR